MNESEKRKKINKKDLYLFVYLYCMLIVIFLPIYWVLDIIGFIETSQTERIIGVLIEALIGALILFSMTKLIKPIDNFEEKLKRKINEKPKQAYIILIIFSFIFICVGFITLIIGVYYIASIFIIMVGFSALIMSTLLWHYFNRSNKSPRKNDMENFKKYRLIILASTLSPIIIIFILLFYDLYQRKAYTMMYLLIIIFITAIAYRKYRNIISRKKSFRD